MRNFLYAAAVICLVLALLSFVGVLKASLAVPLLVVGIVAGILGYFVYGRLR